MLDASAIRLYTERPNPMVTSKISFRAKLLSSCFRFGSWPSWTSTPTARWTSPSSRSTGRWPWSQPPMTSQDSKPRCAPSMWSPSGRGRKRSTYSGTKTTLSTKLSSARWTNWTYLEMLTWSTRYSLVTKAMKENSRHLQIFHDGWVEIKRLASTQYDHLEQYNHEVWIWDNDGDDYNHNDKHTNSMMSSTIMMMTCENSKDLNGEISQRWSWCRCGCSTRMESTNPGLSSRWGKKDILNLATRIHSFCILQIVLDRKLPFFIVNLWPIS